MFSYLRKSIPSDLQRLRVMFSDKNYRIAEFKGLKRDFVIGASAASFFFGAGDIIGQCIEEKQKEKQFSWLGWDKIRTGVVMSEGFLLNGVLLIPFFRFLDIVFQSPPAGAALPKYVISWGPALKKVCVLQFCFVPVSCALFLFLTPSLEFIAYRIILAENPPSWQDSKRTDLSKSIQNSQVKGESEESQEVNFYTDETMLQRAMKKESYVEGILEGAASASSKFKDVYATSLMIWPLIDILNLRYIPLTFRPIWDSAIDMFWTSFLTFKSHKQEDEDNRVTHEGEKIVQHAL